MTRYKKRDAQLKDPLCFHNYKVDDKFKEFIEPRRILEEKSFIFPKQPMGVMSNINNVVARQGWVKFCSHPQDPIVPIVKEFYSNMLQQDQRNIFIRQVQVPLDSRVINVFYYLPTAIECEYTQFAENMTIKKWGEVFKTLTVPGNE